MKKIFKVMLFLAIVALGFFNLKIDNATNLKSSLSLNENSASADSEEEAEKLAFSKSEGTSHVSNTLTKPGGGTCVESYDLTYVYCLGSGSVKCKASSVKSNKKSTC